MFLAPFICLINVFIYLHVTVLIKLIIGEINESYQEKCRIIIIIKNITRVFVKLYYIFTVCFFAPITLAERRDGMYLRWWACFNKFNLFSAIGTTTYSINYIGGPADCLYEVPGSIHSSTHLGIEFF